MSFTSLARFRASSFSIFRRSMLQNDELPFAIDDARFQEAFDEHQVDFGGDEDAVYTPAITLWALVSQVFFAAAQRSCQAAVLRVAALWAVLGRRVCDTNTGAYCRARLKIPFEAVRDITLGLADDAEAAVDRDAVLSLETDTWRVMVSNFGELFFHVAGRPQTVDRYRSPLRDRRFLRVAARQLFASSI